MRAYLGIRKEQVFDARIPGDRQGEPDPGRVYDERYTGDLWEDLQNNIPGTVLPLMVASDNILRL
jgi:hypothetical protein